MKPKTPIIIVIAWLIALALAGHFWPHDNTDPPGGRSGLSVYRDNLTGCEYLQVGLLGGLTPRLGKDGFPVCSIKID